jgi:hypothetical protein
MQTTQEGQMPGLIGEVLLPAFEKYYGFRLNSRDIEFFTEHDAADVEHSRCQIALCGRYLDTPQLQARAEQVAEEICELRWASISELYRSEMLAKRRSCRRGLLGNLLNALAGGSLRNAYLIVPLWSCMNSVAEAMASSLPGSSKIA